MAPILIKQANGSNVQPLINILEHAGQRAVVLPSDLHGELPYESPVLVFAELSPSKAEELEGLHLLHQQVPNAKIIALVDPSEVDETAVQKCSEQPGVFRAFKDPFNSGGLLDVVDRLCPLDSD